ncbi:AraC family transcriptional regulator [Paenibacillus harenae]|uniref:AraC-like DNA-binding protein n=1 Tax=Paenibacillus harenae TaxID=306543 RepID=A0ABT9TUI2_PAEHA|nr:AraC family transcriptional regulator [Paenibacillus harenae]MDQ0111019.1 AraC-like DNA-binding protein [Paenibacillus harenae]
MAHSQTFGAYGYRFQDAPQLPIYQLFAVGHQQVTDPDYYWDGMKRIDGPLYLLQYTISGFGHYRLGDTTYEIGPGTAFLAEIPGDHHYCLPSDSESWTFYFALIRQANLQPLWQELIDSIGVTPHLDPGSSAVRALQRLYSEARMNGIQNSYQASSFVYTLMMELLQTKNMLQNERASWPSSIRDAVKHMELSFAQPESLEEIANVAGLSKYYFARLFVQTTGMSPMDYITKLRIEKAVQLLRGSKLTVDEIAKAVGYANGSYFSKVFRGKIGFPPGDFRLAKELPSIDRLRFD